jgi:hypothetical protein
MSYGEATKPPARLKLSSAQFCLTVSLLGGASSETTICLHRFWRRRFTK